MSTSTKILIVEHDLNDIEFIQRELKKGGIDFVSETVQNELEYRNALKNFTPDIILSDYSLPSLNGQTVFEIREDIAADTPFIFVSGSIGEEDSIGYLKKGVTDYVLKDKLYTLTVKVKRALKDASEKQEKNKINLKFHKAFSDLQKIMNSSLDVICTIDEEGKFVNISSAAEQIFGFKPDELVGKKYTDFVFADDVEITNNAAAGIMNGIPVTFFENRYTRKDRTLVPVIWSAKWDNDDKLMYCIAKDATEKKQLEKAFETERERFYELFLQAPSCMGILKGPDHVFEMANPLYLKLIGKTDILGKAVKEVLPEVVEQGFIKILDDVYNTGKTFSANEMLVKLDKEGKGKLTDIYLNFIYQAYKNNEGIIQGIFFFAVEVTEQVVLRKKIEESEKRFRTMIEKSSDMLTLSDSKGTLFYGTPSITKILGYSFDEFKNKSSMGFIHPDDLALYIKKRNEILQKPGASFANDQRVCHKNGKWVWCEAQVTNMLHEPGINAFVSNFKDISERKSAEQRQEFDKSNLDALINNTKGLMWSVGRDFKLITSNLPFDNTILLISGKALAKGDDILKEGFLPEQTNRLKISYERAFTGETFSEIEHIETPVESWSEISYCPIRNGNKIIGVACHLRDITIIKKAEQQAIISENRFRALIEKSNDMITLVNREGVLTYCSPSVTKILGYTLEELLHKPDSEFIHPNDVAAFKKNINEILETRAKSFSNEQRVLCKNGEWMWCEGTVTNLLDEKGVDAIVSNFRDISERKIAEQHREFNQNNLSALINNTRDLMWSVDTDFKLITSNQPFNDAIMFMSGRAVAKGEDILNTNFLPDQTIRFKKSYERAFAGESFTEIEHSNIPVEVWSEISYCPITNGNEVIGVACHSRDITQLKINERTIRDERILLRTLIDNLPSNVYTKDIHSRKTLSNRGDYKYIGVNSEEEVLGKDDSWFFSDETSRNTRLEEQQIFYSGEPIINKEEHQKKKDGSMAWFLKSKIPLRNQQDEIIGLIGISHDISERKQIEQQLKKSEAFNRGVLNSLSSHIAVIDATGNIVAVNEAWKRFGIENGATTLRRTEIGSNYYEVCKESGKAGVEAALEVLKGLKDVMEEKAGSFYLEYPCHSPNVQRWFGVRAMKFESGEPMIVVSHQDITERRLAEEAMSLTQFAVDNAGDAIFWMEPDARIVNINEAACHLLNYTKEEILTLSVPDIDPYYNAERWVMQFEELRQKRSLFFETIQCSKDGREIPVEIRTTYIKFGDKEFNCAFVRDITERKKAEKKLVQSESRLKEAQAIAHTGNWEIDFETNIHTWSDEYHNILGITKEETHPSLEYYLSFVHPEDIDHVKKVIRENQNINNPIPYEFRFIRKDGVIRYGYAQSRFEFDKNNKPIRLFGIIQDITEKKLAEFKLEQQNKELTKTNFELDRFVYSVSHELRAPLTSVLGLLTFIEEESKEPDTLENAKMIKTSINRLDGFIKNILSYSRNNRIEPEVEEIPLQKTINEILDSLRYMKDAKGINFEVDVHEPYTFYSDKQTFSTIIENLISNAIKFQKEQRRGRYIKIKGSADKYNLKLTIEDNGIGISPEYHDKIFNMFFRLSGKTGGSGMGLYIVKEMIEKLHGTIYVDSQYEAGTAFTIKLKNQTPVSNPIQRGIKNKFKKSINMANAVQHFIVLDDDPDNNIICTRVIKKVFPEAYVLAFTDPDIAISYITSNYNKQNAQDTVLFLDINMPILSGWEFLDAFDQVDIRIKTHLKIYMLTSSFDYRDKQRAEDNKNVLGYFEKPLTKQNVESVVNITTSI